MSKVHYLVPRLVHFEGQKNLEPICREYWVDPQTNGTTDPDKVTCGHCRRRNGFRAALVAHALAKKVRAQGGRLAFSDLHAGADARGDEGFNEEETLLR